MKNGARTTGMTLKYDLVIPFMVQEKSGQVSANSALPWQHLKKWSLAKVYNACQWKNRGVTAENATVV